MSTLLTIEELAERWHITPDELRRRRTKLGLPALNVGTRNSPHWLFRLQTIEAWEAANERACDDDEAKPAEIPVRPGAPPGWDGVDHFAGRKGPRPRA
ncbi:hypothetical protein ACYOEI_18855 [Singulisphaera rosea]